ANGWRPGGAASASRGGRIPGPGEGRGSPKGQGRRDRALLSTRGSLPSRRCCNKPGRTEGRARVAGRLGKYPGVTISCHRNVTKTKWHPFAHRTTAITSNPRLAAPLFAP